MHAENTQRIFFKRSSPVYVMRLLGGLSTDKAQQICNHVREIVGAEYTVREAIKAASKRWKGFSPKQFCSRLIGQAYHEHGYKIVSNPNYCRPGDFLKSRNLMKVSNPTVLVSDPEVRFWKAQTNGSPEAMRAATNYILDGARSIDPNVQSFNDMCRLIMSHPEHDEFINNLHIESGYYDIWKMDYDGFEWRWDIEQMNQVRDTESVRIYCQSTVMGEPRDVNRFTESLAGLEFNHSRYPRETFFHLIKLYQRLVGMHECRFDTATQWLQTH